MRNKTNKRRTLSGFKRRKLKRTKRTPAWTLRSVSESTADYAKICITAEELLEKVRYDVMGIIGSCESPDNANAYDIGYRDGVDEVRVVMDSYFKNLPDEIRTNPEYPLDMTFASK